MAERFIAFRDENAKLAREIAARDARIEELEAETRRLQQTRRDVARRIDELIRQIDQLEGRFPAQPE
jgi:septal ring factor EnvC (AmiA/AmiB activator)